MAAIDSYSFGRITVDGKTYTNDVVIFPDNSILSPWWRKTGHLLELADIEQLIAMSPDSIVAGTGANGLMAVADDLRSYLDRHNIPFIAVPTAEAVRYFNDRAVKETIGGCFHLTC